MKTSNRLFRLSILAGALLAASQTFAATEQLTISTDTTYTAPIEKQAVVINESGTLRGTAGETEMLIQGGTQKGYPRVLSNSGTITDAKSLTVDGGTYNTGTISNIGTAVFTNTYNGHSDSGNFSPSLDNRGSITADTLLANGRIVNTDGTITVKQFGSADYAADFTITGGMLSVTNDAYFKVIRIGASDKETSVSLGGNVYIGEAFRLQDDITATIGGNLTGSGYVSAEAGVIQVNGDVSVDGHVGATKGAKVEVQGNVEASQIQANLGGSVSVNSASVGKIDISGDGSSISVAGVAKTDVVNVNTGSSLHVGELTAKTGEVLESFGNNGSVTIDSSELHVATFTNRGSINADDTGVSHLEILSVSKGAWITGNLNVEDFQISGSLTVNENSTLTVDKLGTAEQTVQAVSTASGATINVAGDAYFNNSVNGSGKVAVAGTANMVAGYQEIRADLTAKDFSALGMTALYGKLNVTNDLALEDKATLIVESKDLTIANDFELWDGAKVQIRSAADGLHLKRVVLNTNDDSYFQAYRNLTVDAVEVNGRGRINTYADGSDSSISIGTLTAADNAVVTFENTGSFDGHKSTASVQTITLGEGSTLRNIGGTHGDVPVPPFNSLQIETARGMNALIQNLEDGSIAIDTLTGSGNAIEVATVDHGVTVAKNESSGLVYRTTDDVDRYGTEGALRKIGEMIGESSESFTAQTADGLVNGAGTALFNADGTVASMTVSESTTMSALKQFSNATLAQWRYETNLLSERLGEVRARPGSAGAWARVYGADSKVTDNVTTEVKINTVQAGGDVMLGNNWIVGGAFSYTSMDGDISNGSADGETYTLAAYASGFFDCGGYIDVIGRIGRLSTDIDAYTSGGKLFDGSYDNTALGLSVETGYHWALNNTFFLEPQAELSYGHVFGDDFKTSSDVSVEQDDFQSLVGRLGARVGASFPKNAGLLYLQASVHHEFLGDNDFDAGLPGQSKQHFTSELDGTWVSYGIGWQFQPTEATSFYGSLSRANGDDYQDDYRYSVGLRYTF